MSGITCGICLADDIDEIGQIDCCNHSFHFTCIGEWSHRENRCPFCKARFSRIQRRRLDGTLLETKQVQQRDQVHVPENVPPELVEWLATLYCQMCGHGDREDELLICDGCERGYHTSCVGLNEVPEDDWLCPECAEAQQARTAAAAAARRRSGRGASTTRGPRAQQPVGRRLRRGAGSAAGGSAAASARRAAAEAEGVVDLVPGDDEASLEEWQEEQEARSSASDDDGINWEEDVAAEAADLVRSSSIDGSSSGAAMRRGLRRAVIAQLNARQRVPASAEGSGRGGAASGRGRSSVRGGRQEPRVMRYDDLQRVEAARHAWAAAHAQQQDGSPLTSPPTAATRAGAAANNSSSNAAATRHTDEEQAWDMLQQVLGRQQQQQQQATARRSVPTRSSVAVVDVDEPDYYDALRDGISAARERGAQLQRRRRARAAVGTSVGASGRGGVSGRAPTEAAKRGAGEAVQRADDGLQGRGTANGDSGNSGSGGVERRRLHSPPRRSNGSSVSAASAPAGGAAATATPANGLARAGSVPDAAERARSRERLVTMLQQQRAEQQQQQQVGGAVSAQLQPLQQQQRQGSASLHGSSSGGVQQQGPRLPAALWNSNIANGPPHDSQLQLQRSVSGDRVPQLQQQSQSRLQQQQQQEEQQPAMKRQRLSPRGVTVAAPGGNGLARASSNGFLSNGPSSNGPSGSGGHTSLPPQPPYQHPSHRQTLAAQQVERQTVQPWHAGAVYAVPPPWQSAPPAIGAANAYGMPVQLPVQQPVQPLPQWHPQPQTAASASVAAVAAQPAPWHNRPHPPTSPPPPPLSLDAAAEAQGMPLPNHAAQLPHAGAPSVPQPQHRALQLPQQSQQLLPEPPDRAPAAQPAFPNEAASAPAPSQSLPPEQRKELKASIAAAVKEHLKPLYAEGAVTRDVYAAAARAATHDLYELLAAGSGSVGALQEEVVAGAVERALQHIA